jgi:hypothetical protein
MTSKTTERKASDKECAQVRMLQAKAAIRRLRRRVEMLPDGNAKTFYLDCIRDVSMTAEV